MKAGESRQVRSALSELATAFLPMKSVASEIVTTRNFDMV
jgi:hypothetical protein